MVAKNKTMKIACCVMADGDVAFTLADQTSINTVMEKWNDKRSKEERLKYKEAGTQGGVVVITMLSSNYFKLPLKDGWLIKEPT
ncbi:hypothetical protein LCGC14_0481340 [marine sediment metagenome]|uniref:Uncharacterized protein n=1 Tax=marine sediment metagenome TaxID=412755 RepID=A0A0F9SEG2_9ZZZZ